MAGAAAAVSAATAAVAALAAASAGLDYSVGRGVGVVRRAAPRAAARPRRHSGADRARIASNFRG